MATETTPAAEVVLPLLINTEAAGRLIRGCTARTVLRWIESGEIPAEAVFRGPPRYLLKRLVLEKHFGIESTPAPKKQKRGRQ